MSLVIKKTLLAAFCAASCLSASPVDQLANLLPQKTDTIKASIIFGEANTKERASSKIIRDAVFAAGVSEFLIAEKSSLPETVISMGASLVGSTCAINMMQSTNRKTQIAGAAVLALGQNFMRIMRMIDAMGKLEGRNALAPFMGHDTRTKLAFLVSTFYPFLTMAHLNDTKSTGGGFGEVVEAVGSAVVSGLSNAANPNPVRNTVQTADAWVESLLDDNYFTAPAGMDNHW